jgi:hypothetical protein
LTGPTVLSNVFTQYQNSSDDRIKVRLDGQKIAYAPNSRIGGTNFATDYIRLGAVAPPPGMVCPVSEHPGDSLREKDQPPFYPLVVEARATVPGVAELTGTSGLVRVSYFTKYRDSGFDTTQNKGEVFLKLIDTIPMNFGGGGTNVDSSGGIATPSAVLLGISRSVGAVSGNPVAAPLLASLSTPDSIPVPTDPLDGPLEQLSKGIPNPKSLFSLNAKILGGVSLQDIVSYAEGSTLIRR